MVCTVACYYIHGHTYIVAMLEPIMPAKSWDGKSIKRNARIISKLAKHILSIGIDILEIYVRF